MFSHTRWLPALSGSQIQTHWYYERARGQYLNDQAGLTPAKSDQFVRLNPRKQVITKTDLAKVEICFNLLPDVACRGAEKAFVAFAEQTTKAWQNERNRSLYGDDWFRAAVARIILFRTAESLVSKASWYAPGTRAQAVAHTTAKLAHLSESLSEGGQLDFLKVWAQQVAGEVLERQLLVIGEVVMNVLLKPPQVGQNVGEWAKQQACRQRVFEAKIPVVPGFKALVLEKTEVTADARQQRGEQRVTDALATVTEVINLGGPFWARLLAVAGANGLLSPEDDSALAVASKIPQRVPTDRQADRVIAAKARCEAIGLEV